MKSLMFKSEYEKMFKSEEVLWWYKGLRRLISHYVQKYARPDAAILDVGCGTGKNMEHLMSLGYTRVEGIDYSHDAVEFCLKRGLSKVKLGSITAIDYADSSFDVILCMDVLGCLEEEDRNKAVSEMFRVLKPGGLFLANSASLEIFRSQHDLVGNIKIRFDKAQFIGLFRSLDLQVLKASYRVFLLSPLVGVFKLAKKLLLWLLPNQTPKSDQVIFPKGINWLLLQVQLLENRIFRGMDLPFGTSLFIVLSKQRSEV